MTTDIDTRDDAIRVSGISFFRDEGTVVVFRGYTDDPRGVEFAIDHRPAYQLIEALNHDAEDFNHCFVYLEPWQIIRSWPLGDDEEEESDPDPGTPPWTEPM